MLPHLSNRRRLSRNNTGINYPFPPSNQLQGAIPRRVCRLRRVARRNDLITNIILRRGSPGSIHIEQGSIRDERISSLPSQRDVEQRRLEEGNRGGPSAPRNSVALNDFPAVTANGDELPEVFSNPQEDVTVEENDFDADSINEIVPPVSNIIRDRLNALEESIMALRAAHRNFVAAWDVFPDVVDDNLPEVLTNRNDDVTDDVSSYNDIIRVGPPVSSILRDRLNILRENIVSRRAIREAVRASINNTVDQFPATSSFVTCPYIPSVTTSPVSDDVISISSTSPSAASLRCPVCLETFSSIHKRGSSLVSTVCGHVFCGKCLPVCVRTSGQCPACRRKLGYQDFHPLYLYY